MIYRFSGVVNLLNHCLVRKDLLKSSSGGKKMGCNGLKAYYLFEKRFFKSPRQEEISGRFYYDKEKD
jgi:hypothetical protein